MKNFKFATLIDFIFVNLLIFLITFTWSRFLTRNLILSFFIGLICIAIFIFFNNFSRRSKKNKINITKSLQKDIDSYLLTLLSNSCAKNIDYFANALKNEEEIKILKDQNLIIYNLNNCLCPMFNEKILSLTSCLKQVRIAIENNLKTIKIVCFEIDSKTKLELSQIQNIEIEIIDKNNIYTNFFVIYQSYPDIIFKTKAQKKLKFKQIINLSFCKSRCKNYFLSGLFILFCSMFVRLNLYYVFFSSLMFLFAIISLTKKTN